MLVYIRQGKGYVKETSRVRHLISLLGTDLSQKTFSSQKTYSYRFVLVYIETLLVYYEKTKKSKPYQSSCPWCRRNGGFRKKCWNLRESYLVPSSQNHSRSRRWRWGFASKKAKPGSAPQQKQIGSVMHM